jgi:serine/threonine-protein kinase
MVTVYRGPSDCPIGFEPLLAIKLLHAHLSTEAKVVKPSLDEARIVVRIRYPHVVLMIEVVQVDNRYFPVTDYMRDEWLSSSGDEAQR